MEEFLKKVLERKPHGAFERYKLEKELHERYGEEGIRVYLLVDGTATVEEVMGKAGVNEERMRDIVSFLQQKGALKGEVIAPTKILTPEEEKPQKELPPIPLIKTEEKSSALEAMMTKEAEKAPKPEVAEAKPVEVLQKPEQVEMQPQRIPKTPLERKLFDKFGEAGLTVYSLIDESKTPRDILAQTKMSEEELVRILEFMNSEGIIRLEKPKEAMEKPIIKTPPQPPPLETQPAPPLEKKEVKVELPKPVEKPSPPPPVEKPSPVTFDRTEIYLPTAVGMNLLTKLKVEGEILRKYGNEGVKAFSSMNGKRTTVRIVKEVKINPAHLDDLIAYLMQKGAVKLKQLTPQEIKETYGEEGLSIYNKYKRDGILLYELIDKKANLKDIVRTSGIEPRLAVEIFAFIHKVLGLEIPLDKELLYKQLGIKP